MQSDYINIIILAVIQGITEFLPISSSGHLVIFQNLLGFTEDNVFFAVILHTGTLASILVYYRHDLAALVRLENRRIPVAIAVGTMPLIALGSLIKPVIEHHFNSLWVVAAGLLVTSLLLLVVHRRTSGEKTGRDISVAEALWIGLIQCLAITPGISRSGSTIALASRLGIQHEAAAQFSFFLGIPAIAGATILKVKDMFAENALAGRDGVHLFLLSIIGFCVSFVVGYIALALLIRTLRSNRFSYFGYYCLFASLAVAISQFLDR